MTRLTTFALTTAMLGACGGDSGNDDAESGGNAPMKEGTWHLGVDRVTRNTCESAGVSDDDIGEGQAVTVTLTLNDNGRGFTIEDDDGDTSGTFDLDGDEFSREYDSTTEVEDPCYLRADSQIDGRFTSKSFATSDLTTDISTEGNCSAVNTDGLPCSYDAELSWEYVGD